MSSDIAIKVENLSKCYQIYEQPRDRLKQFVMPRVQRALGKQPQQYYREFWGLKDVSFEVKKGETVGIIGRNGSGKSTLLQIICDTLNPTGGSVTTHGRIAALLELGSGFNPEFTGRENVFLNASVLGLSLEEIRSRYEEIVEFADIGDFLDRPVKTYSSGMVVRLAFAVAVNSNPQILIVDEALSVGDELFQRKCFSRIEAISNSGATILFVSHSATSIVELCDRAVFLHCGELLAIGSPKHIVGRYQKLLYAPPDKHDQLVLEIRNENDKKRLVQAELTGQNVSETFFFSPEIKTTINLDSYDPGLIPTSLISYGPYGATILDPTIYTKSDDRVNNLTRGTTYRFQYRVRFDHPAINVRFGMLIKTISGLELGGGVSASSNHLGLTVVEAETVYSVEFEFCCRLNPGVYFMNAGVSAQVNGYDTYLHRLVDAAMFRVRAEDENLATVIIDFSCAPTFKLIT